LQNYIKGHSTSLKMKKMKTNRIMLLLGVLLLTLVNEAFAGGKKKTVKKAVNKQLVVSSKELLWVADSSYNFGSIPQGAPVSIQFVLTNTGNKVMAITNVGTSCGCTTPVWDTKPILPGKTTTITVGYNAASTGSFSKNITVSYGNGHTKNLVIQGEVMQ
jgi:hypothetical protein